MFSEFDSERWLVCGCVPRRSTTPVPRPPWRNGGLEGWACRTAPSASPSSVWFAWDAWLLVVCSQMPVVMQNIDLQRRSPVLRRPSLPRLLAVIHFAINRRASSGPSPLPASGRSSAPERTPLAHRVSAEGTQYVNSVLVHGAQQQQADAVNIESYSRGGCLSSCLKETRSCSRLEVVWFALRPP